MTTKPFRFSKRFDESACDFCGLCFHQCPVLALPLEEAQAEIRRLVHEGRSKVLARCTGCMACNSFCPHDANPHTLIVSRWEERYRRHGIPARGRVVLPYQKPNLYTLAIARLPADEKALVNKWERNWREPPGEHTMLYAGCNMLLQPFLLDSKILDGVPIFGSPSICCAEPLYRMGCWDAAKAAAAWVRDEFQRMRLEKVIVPCLAGFHMFKYVYPEVLDVDLDCEVVSVTDWLLERIEAGEIEVKPLGKQAVIHDSCWPKASGDHFFDGTRRLLARLGVTVVEPEHTREEALCCGMCAPAARFSLLDVLRASKARLVELEAAQADMAVDYCGGCNWLLSLAGTVSSAKLTKPLYHVLELVQMAAGETPKHRTDERARQVLKSIAGRVLAGYLSPRRFRIDEIEGRPVRRSEEGG